MSTVSTVDIGGNDYDVYGTEAERDIYMASKLNSAAYDTASADDRNKAHVEATRWIDRERWLGTRTDVATPQPLAHPRIGLVTCDGEAVDETLLAPGICEGTFELILKILQTSGAVLTTATTGKNLKRAKAGSAEVEFFQPGRDASGQKGKPFPPEAYKLVQCYLDRGLGSGSIAFGTDQESDFEDCDQNGLTEGYS